MEAKVKQVLEKIRPMIQADGGDIEFVNLDEKEGIVKIRFKGACVGCPMSTVTLHAGIAHQLRQEIPEIKEVEAIE